MTGAGLARIIRFIDEERERQGLSGRELSERANLGVTTVSRILSGQAAPGLDTLDAIAQALGYTLESLLMIGLQEARKQKEMQHLMAAFDELSAGEREAVLGLALYFRDRRPSPERS